MRDTRKTVLLIATCVTVFVTTHIQRTEAKNGGRLFALSYMNLTNPTSAFEQIFISSFMETTLVSISIPQINHFEVISLDRSNNWRYAKNIMQDISVPIDVFPASSMAIIIAAQNGTISVHTNKAIPNSGAGYLSLALRSRGAANPLYNHHVPGCNSTGRSFLSIISVYNNTCVSVDQYNATVGAAPRRLHFSTMQANEVFNMYSDNTDYTGVLVSARKPIAVYGGCDCVDVPDNTAHCDHIMEQVPYVEQLGSENGTRFVMASVAGRPYNVGFNFRIISATYGKSLDVLSVMEYSFSKTTFAYDSEQQLLPTAPYELARGAFLEFTAGRKKDLFTVVFVSCSDRCEVLQYNPSLEVVTPVAARQPSDPFMVIVPSDWKYTADITFYTSSVNVGGTVTTARNYITIVAKTAAKDILTLDNTLISALPGFIQWINRPAMGDIHVATFDNGYALSDGFHTLTTTRPLSDPQQYYNAFVYGHGSAGTHTSYGYLAGYDLTMDDPEGPWYEMSVTDNDQTPTPTAAADVATTAGPDAVADDDLPTFSMLYVANFTALDPGPIAKTPDYSCSNNYAWQFYWRIGQLTQRISGPSSLRLRALDVPKCASSNIDIVVTPYSDIYYFSEYSHSSGKFGVNITGNGTATLSDINTCAMELATYIRDPVNWINDINVVSRNQVGNTGRPYHFTRFLRNDHPLFENLTDCAEQYVSTIDHLLTLYGSGWVCPLTIQPVVGAASRQVFTPLSTVSLALAVSYVVRLTLTGRHR